MTLDTRELAQRIRTLQGSITKNDPPQAIKPQLDALKNEPSPTEEQLRSTKAGMIIGKLRSNADKELARLATEIVQKWKKSVEAEKNNRGSGAKASKPSPSPAPTASPAPKSATGQKRKFEGDAEKRNFKTENVNINRLGITDRDNCIGLLYNGLAYRSYEPAETVLAKAMEVEKAAYDLFGNANKDYKNKIRSLFSNLKVKTNAELGQGVMSGEILSDKFVKMSSGELMSAEQRRLNAELEKENMKKAQVPMVDKSVSEELQCSNCKQKKVSYTQAQTRSADEPMTTFCECMNCGKRWKFS